MLTYLNSVRSAPPRVHRADQEAIAFLTQHAWEAFGDIPATVIACHVVAMTPLAQWPVRRAALDALRVRYAEQSRHQLQVSPASQGRASAYRVVPTDQGASPKVARVELTSTNPIALSCDCADYVRNGLGLCRHGFAVLCSIWRRNQAVPPRVQAPMIDAGRPPRLVWDCRWPNTGPHDRLLNLRLVTGAVDVPRLTGMRDGRPTKRALSNVSARARCVAALQDAIAERAIECEPAVTTLLAEEAWHVARRQELERVRAERGSPPNASLTRQLYPYQTEAVERFLGTGALLLADDMGLGKTTQAIAMVHTLAEAGVVRRALIIVPTPLKGQWLREWRQTSMVPVATVDGPARARHLTYRGTDWRVLVVGYEQFRRDISTVREVDLDMVVLDEGQRIKNAGTLTARCVKSLRPRYRLALTGTPMENRLEELGSIMEFVDELSLQPNWRLTPTHVLRYGDGGPGQSGVTALRALRDRLAPWMLRRRRCEVLDQLPGRTDTNVPVEMTPAQHQVHESLRPPLLALIRNARARRCLTAAERVELLRLLTTQRVICNGLAQLRFETVWPLREGRAAEASFLGQLHTPKLAALRALMEQLIVVQERKVVVFSQWRRMLRLAHWAVADLIHGVGKRAAFFTGAERAPERERALVEFHDDPSLVALFLSDAGGVGLNLQRAASCCINLELPWNPAIVEQRVGRIHRLGQTEPVDVFNFVSSGGIEARIATVLQRKAAVFTTLFDGNDDELLFSGESNFLDSVAVMVEDEPVATEAA